MFNISTLVCLGIALVAYTAANDTLMIAMMTSSVVLFILGKLEKK